MSDDPSDPTFFVDDDDVAGLLTPELGAREIVTVSRPPLLTSVNVAQDDDSARVGLRPTSVSGGNAERLAQLA